MSTAEEHRLTSNHALSKRDIKHSPAALAEALRAVHHTPDTPSDSNSDAGFEARDQPLQSVLLRRKPESDSYDNSATETPEIISLDESELREKSSSEQLRQSLPRLGSADRGKKTYVVASDDAELREILRRGMERASYHSRSQSTSNSRNTNIRIGTRKDIPSSARKASGHGLYEAIFHL